MGNVSWISHQIHVSMNLHVENPCSQVSARQVELLDVEERMVTCLVIPKSTMLVLASTSTLGELDTVNGNQGLTLSSQLLSDLGAGSFLQVCSYLFSAQDKESLSLRMTEGCQAGEGFDVLDQCYTHQCSASISKPYP